MFDVLSGALTCRPDGEWPPISPWAWGCRSTEAGSDWAPETERRGKTLSNSVEAGTTLAMLILLINEQLMLSVKEPQLPANDCDKYSMDSSRRWRQGQIG